MSPRNLIAMSLLVVLVSVARAASVEEREETEPAEEAEVDRSEEDEGPASAHQSAAGASAAGVRPGVSSSLPDVSGGQEVSAAAGRAEGGVDASTDSDDVDAHPNANGEKLLSGMGGATGATGALTSLEGGASPPEYTGTADSHFLLGLPGEATWTDSTDQESLIESDVIKQTEGEHAWDQSASTPAADHVHDHLSWSSSSSAHQEGGERSQANGNGRQTHLLDKDGVTPQMTSFSPPAVDLHAQQLPWTRPSASPPVLHLSTLAQDNTRVHTGGTDSSLHVRSEPAGGTLVDTPLSGTCAHTLVRVPIFTCLITAMFVSGTLAWGTDSVTMATDSQATGTSLDSSGGRAWQEPHKAGSVTERYDAAWGPGPEGEVVVVVAVTTALHGISGATFVPTAADNVEVDDTC
ncbi:uncharacterized protein LOC144037164 isoform X3 [Vanacampus margaritifer]